MERVTTTQRLPAARSGSDSIWSRPRFNHLLFAANGLLILGFWWFSSGFEIGRSPSDALNGLGRMTGLLGTYLVLWQLLMLARVPWLEDAFGLERLAQLHRWNGYLVIVLLVAHGVFQTIGYMLGDGKNLAAQLGDFVQSYPGLLAAIVSLALLLLVVGVSVTIARRHLAYETWYFVHLYTYLAIALAFIHQLPTGVDFAGNPAFTGYWVALYLIVFGLLLLHRVAAPLLVFQRHRFHVESVRKEARGVFSIYIAGRDLDQFQAHAGQFAFWRFWDRRRWWQAHPFSLSAVPDGRRLRITVRDIGDFTHDLHTLKPGTPVLVDGPFGKFVERPGRDRVLLVAGGIGITPLRALAEAMARDGFGVRLLYRAHRRDDLVFREELDGLASELGVGVDYLLSESGAGRPQPRTWFEPAALARLVPDIAERAVFVCGPPGMRRQVLAALRALGVPPSQVRAEVFRLQ